MKIAGEATLVAPVEQVWDALLDPAVGLQAGDQLLVRLLRFEQQH